MTRTALALAACLLLAASPAQAGQELGVKVHRIVPQDPVLELVVSVDDAEGRPVTALGLADFDVRIQDAEARVLSARSFVDAGMPFGTLLLIDTSGSMRGSMDEVREAARRYVAGMAGGDVAIVAQFNDTVIGLDQPWTADKAELGRQIDALEAAGSSTHLYEALNRGINMIASGSDAPALRNILVLSDGKDVGSPVQWTYDRARGMAGTKDVPISAVGYVVNPKDDRTASLAQLSLDTGGRYSPAASVDEIEQRFRGVQHAIHALWVLSVETGPMEAGDRQLAVEVGGTGTETGAIGSTGLSLDHAWNGNPDLLPEEPWWAQPRYLGLAGGGAALALLFLVILVVALRIRSRRALEARIDGANQAADDARRAAETQVAEAKRDAEAARALAAEAQATAEQARISAEAPVPPPEPPQPEPPKPEPPKGRRQTVIQTPGGQGGSVALLLADGSRILLAGLDDGPVPLGKDPARARIVLDHPTVSGHHADVSLQGGLLVVTDAGSSNGTYVDGEDIRGRGAVAVRAGQQLQLGLLKTVVEAS